MDTLIEPKYRYNTRRLPPIPEWMNVKERVEWARCWRSLYLYHRWQLSEDCRYWISVRETVGAKEAFRHLGEQDVFSLESLSLQPDPCDCFADIL